MRISRILAPLDVENPSRDLVLATVESAAYFAERLGASVDVLYVFDPRRFPSRRDEFIRSFAASTARREMLECLRALEFRGVRTVRARVELALRPIAETIVNAAVLGDYDLIVLSSHQHGLLHSLFQGSVSDSVLRRAPCPVLLLHPDHAPAKPADDRPHDETPTSSRVPVESFFDFSVFAEEEDFP
jgi:nucleotide-binding universal stress UspA family protein